MEFRVDPKVQERVNELARKANEGELTEAEKVEYQNFIEDNDIIAILQSKARDLTIPI